MAVVVLILTNVISFHLPSCLSHASTFRVIWSSWSPYLATPTCNALRVLHHAVTSFHRNLYFRRCSPEFSPFRPSSDSSSSSSHNAQNSHHEDKPKGTKPLSRSIINDAMRCDLTPCLCLIFIGGAPNRPLPPTPDEEESGDRTLVMKRVSTSLLRCKLKYTFVDLCSSVHIFHFDITWNFHIPLVCNVQSYVIMFSSSRKAIDTCFLL